MKITTYTDHFKNYKIVIKSNYFKTCVVTLLSKREKSFILLSNRINKKE